MEDKVCSSCRKIKKLDHFHFSSRSKDRRQGVCKQCKRKYNEAWVVANWEHVRNVKLKWKAKDPNYTRKQKQLEKTRCPLQFKARRIWYLFAKRNKIQKQSCAICGSSQTQAHHADYNAPLDIQWFCPIHHAAWHRNFIAIGGASK